MVIFQENNFYKKHANKSLPLKWYNNDKLFNYGYFSKITKYNSTHSRITLPKIKLTHYWIDLN
jgi:hypothetical protein